MGSRRLLEELPGLGRSVGFFSNHVCYQCRRVVVTRAQAGDGNAGLRKITSRTMSTSSRLKAQQQPQPHHRRESIRPETFYDYFPTTIPSGPPPGSPFAIDISTLHREFLTLQATAHPDRQRAPELKARAEAVSAQINTAFKTLADPLLRAQYLLSLRGIDVAEDETAKTEDQELLMAVLEAQEEIEEAEQDGELKALRETNQQRYNQCVDALEEAFAKDDIDVAKEETIKLRYWVNIEDALKEWEPGKKVRLIH